MDLAIVRRTGMAAYLDSTAVTVFMVEVKRPRDRCGFEDGDFVMNSENPCDLFKAHADQVLAQVWIRWFFASSANPSRFKLRMTTCRPRLLCTVTVSQVDRLFPLQPDSSCYCVLTDNIDWCFVSSTRGEGQSPVRILIRTCMRLLGSHMACCLAASPPAQNSSSWAPTSHWRSDSV